MFAPPVARPKAKLAAPLNEKSALRRAPAVGHRHGDGAEARMLQRSIYDSVMLRPVPRGWAKSPQERTGLPERETGPESTDAKLDPPGSAWERLSLFVPGRMGGFEPPSLAPAPRSPIQAKLKVGAVNDPIEQEADSVADQVMRMPEPHLQHACACGGECLKCRKEHLSRGHELSHQMQVSDVRETEVLPILEDQLSTSKGGGSPMSKQTRAFMEPRFAFDFSKVRIHADSNAVQMNQQLSAHAFTHGDDIYFGVGQSPSDYRLLAHELTHVTQQTGRVQSNLTVDQPRGKSGQIAAQVMRQSGPSTLTPSSEDKVGGLYDDQSLPLNQGQADGKTIQEDCKRAKEDCKSSLDCSGKSVDVDKSCDCWKGGEYPGGYTCTASCRCKKTPMPNS